MLDMDGTADHENLVGLFNLAVAARLRATLAEAGLVAEQAWSPVEAAPCDPAMPFDASTFVVNGQTFRPRVAVAQDDGTLLPGAAEFGYAHGCAAGREDELARRAGFSITR